MVQQETRVNVADNSGAKQLLIIKVLGGARHLYAGVATTTISTLTASNGVAGSTASRYGSYGGGGVSRNGTGQGGYIRIAI